MGLTSLVQLADSCQSAQETKAQEFADIMPPANLELANAVPTANPEPAGVGSGPAEAERSQRSPS